MSLLDISYKPAPVVTPLDTIRDAVATALPANCDAVAVIEENKIVGILTSRDIMLKVVLNRKDTESTLVQDIMTSPVLTLHPNTDAEEALALMLDRNIRHILLSEDGASTCGLLSLRKLLSYIVEEQRDDLDHLANFLMVDGHGG